MGGKTETERLESVIGVEWRDKAYVVWVPTQKGGMSGNRCKWGRSE